ncbi:AI-2E family transporter [Pelobium manganitolerans]|uniref:AI-2E family transporter n=1 Tax=Pelobium manganitolerans TaxID=1842495 RepID=A0A419S8E1_9SPHI|nr:AI-2E family transporter [Pelobium manganitolerans]RKD18197.1 AI-2E family transporter [Pelobium manganitolerans]
MKEFPVTAKRALELLGLVLIGFIILVGSNVIMPLLLAFFLSMLLLPVYRFLVGKKIPTSIAIIIPILILIVVVAGLIWFFSAQINVLVSDFPQIKKNINIHLNALSNWISGFTHYSTKEQIAFINEQSNKLLNSTGAILGSIFNSVSGAFIFFGLLPIYIYLILAYKNLLLKFCIMWFSDEDLPNVKESIQQIEKIIQSYLMGLLIQIAYITVLLGGILWIIGIKHALLIGVLFAVLNLIPYIGALFGNILGVLLTVSSSQEIWPIFTVLGVIAVVQFLDNNILMPRIVGSKVQINSLVALVGIVVAGSLAGISGMFLALPIIAILKIAFDRTNNFKKWGVLLGTDVPEKNPLRE